MQRITHHDRNTPGTLHYNATWVGLCDVYRGGDGRYFLEASLLLFLPIIIHFSRPPYYYSFLEASLIMIYVPTA